MKYYIGWDVGAWHCDRNAKSRDALCVLVDDGNKPKLAGAVWRGNLRSKLNTSRRPEPVRNILSCCLGQVSEPHKLVIAIDTPLGWPSSLVSLLYDGGIVEVEEEFRQNPYLFRETERFLSEHGFKPLSAVQDMIGSPSTKGIHFLQAANSQVHDVGVWKSGEPELGTTIIETYPAPCEKSTILQELFCCVAESEAFREQVDGKGRAFRKDVLDALRCALVAWLHANKPQCLAIPTSNADCKEGWIWVPEDALS